MLAFGGEVVESYAFERHVRDGKPDVSQMEILSYLTKVGEYRSLGESIAKARHVGREFCKE